MDSRLPERDRPLLIIRSRTRAGQDAGRVMPFERMLVDLDIGNNGINVQQFGNMPSRVDPKGG